jgi:hypothetical protein
VYVGSDTDDGDFFLVDGPIDKGLFDYDLFLTPDNVWVLASYLDGDASSIPGVVTGIQDSFYQATGIGRDRMADLRGMALCGAQPAYEPGVNPTADVPCSSDWSGASMWLNILGGQTDLDSREKRQIFNKELKFNTGWESDFFGIVGGVDWGSTWDNGYGQKAGWYAGVLAGYVTSSQDFNTGGSSDYDSGLFGLYGTYINGGWYAGGLLAGQWGNDDLGFAHESNGEDASNLGFTFDAGYRFGALAGQEGFFVEPGVTLAFVSTNIDGPEFLGTEVDIDDSTSSRGRLGARAGFVSGQWSPYVYVDLWKEWGDDPSVEFSSPLSGGWATTSASLDGDNFGTWVAFGGGFDVLDLGEGWSAFANADFRTNDDLWGWTGRGGFRYSFQ